MNRGIDILLGEILDAIDLIRDYTEGLEFDEFAGNVEKQDSVIRRLEIIGEAVKGFRLHIQSALHLASNPSLVTK